MSVARRPQVGDGIESIAKKGVKDVNIFCCAYYFIRWVCVFCSGCWHVAGFDVRGFSGIIGGVYITLIGTSDLMLLLDVDCCTIYVKE